MAYNDGEEGRTSWLYMSLGLGAATAGVLLSSHLLGGVPGILEISYHAMVVGVGAYVGYLGLRELISEKRFSVEFLMAVAALGAIYLDLHFEGATVLALYSLAEYLEDYIEDRARRTVQELSQYMPEGARVVDRGSERMVEVGSVKPGTTILVRPGERIPLDGVVLDGSSYVDQSPVTGESMPVFKKRGDEVFGGTLNLDGVLRIRVAREASESLVSKIVGLVVESKRRKARIERLVDRVAKFYVPAVITSAVATATLVPTVVGGSFKMWLYRSLILLVASCPSAFVVSVPATFFTAMTAAARRGVIIKGGVYIEKMARVRTVVFDKTGTLTLGAPRVVEECPFTQIDDETLRYAAALERYSNHPIARAIVRRAVEAGLDVRGLKVEDVREEPGMGVVGVVEGVRVSVGKPVSLGGAGYGDGHTRVQITVGESRKASLCLADQARSDARGSLSELRRMGLYTVMLTGDKWEVAKRLAETMGMDEVYAELLPEDKLRIVSRLRSERGMVAMVGDGVNDAPALAAADVGIAMGGRGVDVALESADVVLVRDQLSQIPYIYGLSRAAMKIAKQNIAISLGTKLLLGMLGFMGFLPLWFAVAVGDDGITMLLILNTLRITRQGKAGSQLKEV